MAALSTDRNTPRKGILRQVAYPVKASTVIYGGSIVAIDATGYAVPAADAANLKVVGVADERADNSAGASGAIDCKVIHGTFKVANNGTNPVVQATVGAAPQIADDQTVRASGATNANTAGIVDRLEADGVWITVP